MKKWLPKEYHLRCFTRWITVSQMSLFRRKEAASDEMKHAMWIHDVAVAEVEKLKQVYQPPVEMLEKWDEAHKHYVEKSAWIKTMLSM